jgi:hypothetical protein
MDLGFILLAIALIGLVIFIVAQPFLEHSLQRERPERRADQLAAERDGILAALRDLDFDHATGKITDDDYAMQRAPWVASGAEVLKQLEALDMTPDDEAIERAIAARRKAASNGQAAGAMVALTCSECGAAARADDRFCAGCGAALARVCGQCQSPLVAEDRFCGKCGAPVTAEAKS